MQDVTFIILTKNEEKNIGECLRSVAGFAKRVIVVDSLSDDDTVRIAESMGAEVVPHPFENYARQFNYALDNCHIETVWTFRLDADERLTPELTGELAEIMEKHGNDDVTGVSMEALLYFMDAPIRHGCRNKRKIMLFKTDAGRIEDRRMDEHTCLSYGRCISAKNRFIHRDFRDLSYFVRKLNWYATREMQDYIEFKNGKSGMSEGEQDRLVAAQRKKKFGFYYKFPKFLRCRLLFLYYYIFRLGFLDGKAGYIYNYMYHMWYRTLVDAKIAEQEITNAPFEITGDLK